MADDKNHIFLTRRRIDLDIARAFAALAVVAHHISQYYPRYGMSFISQNTLKTIVEVVSFLHIPTFMLVAATLLRKNGGEICTLKDYFNFEQNKFYRLMVPFLAVSSLHFAIKLIVPLNVSSRGLQSFINTFVAPRGGAAGHLWFLYCLMSIFLIWPALVKLTGKSFQTVLIISFLLLAVAPISWPVSREEQPLLGLADLVWYITIFAIGFYYGDVLFPDRPKNVKEIIGVIMIFCTCLLLYLKIDWPVGIMSVTFRNILRMLGYLCGGITFIWLGRWLCELRFGNILATVGLYSYDIYLLHVALVAHPLTFMLGKLNLSVLLEQFLFVPCILMTMVLSLVIGQMVRRIPILGCMVLGAAYKGVQGSTEKNKNDFSYKS